VSVDDERGPAAANVSRAELTAPYAALLDEDLVANAMNEVEMLRQQAESGPDEPLSVASVSIFDQMAGATGLEPATSAVTGREKVA
jgi:hypothetical protein